MLKKISVKDFQKRFALGERDFSHSELRRINLRDVNLKNINLEGSDLSFADLSNADLSNANLSGCYLNEANLTNAKLQKANLTGTYLIKAYLTKANFMEANLQDAYLTGAFLTKANFIKANISGAILQNTQLTGIYLNEAVYSSTTRFGKGFDPEKTGMKKISSFYVSNKGKITVEHLVNNFESIISLVSNYLGTSITIKYVNSSRPDIEWLQGFVIDANSKINFNGSLNTKVTRFQLKWFEKWETAFIKSCSLFIQDLPNIIEEKHLGLNYIGEKIAA